MNALVALVVTALGLGLVAAGCGDGGDTGSGAGDPRPGRPGDGGPSQAGWKTDFSMSSVPLSEFLSGGPGKDGIPSIDAPRFETVEKASEWLEEKEPVIELEVDGNVRAYPLQVLIWHEIVNDEAAGVPVTVTFCPLCNTALVFDRRVEGRVLDFGTTGNLRNSDLVMYDRQTESWWQQFGGEALVGELTGTELELVPSRIVAWRDFARTHPDGEVLSRETGFNRSYGQNPYTGYDDVDSPPFVPAANLDDERMAPKERVVFVERGGDAVAISFAALEDDPEMDVEMGGETLRVTWTGGARSALDDADIQEGREVGAADVQVAETGEPVAFDTPFWFAVAAFRPDVRVIGK